MKLYPPKGFTWWLTVILCLVGITLYQGWIIIPMISGYTFWVVVVAFLILAASNLIKGL